MTSIAYTPTEAPPRCSAYGNTPSGSVSTVPGLSFGLVGTYPPMRCGIATFTMSLAHAIERLSWCDGVGVVPAVDRPMAVHPPEVVAEWLRGSSSSLAAAAAVLNTFDVVVVQHEFGIYGGVDGEEIVDLVRQLSVPVIVVLHTVLAQPSPHQRLIIEEVGRVAASLVVQADCAGSRLLATHAVPPEQLSVIPHGAYLNLAPDGYRSRAGRRPVVLTWGLIGPGKGIEFGIAAMAQLRDLEPAPRYLVLGQTHPRVLARDGEVYRQSLIAKAKELGVEEIVAFRDVYLKRRSILASIRAADLVLLPYLSRDQVVSGVLVEAIASGKPVVATRFPHAVEMLEQGSGILVPHENAHATAAALRSLLTDTGLAGRMAAVARDQAPALAWDTVGTAYLRLAHTLVPAKAQNRN
jgi:polysaccharide biosynthesis protein PslF